MAVLDLTGQRFGRLVVIRRAPNTKAYPPAIPRGKVQWLCQCDCGSERVALTQRLRNGETRSCGCLHRETAHDRLVRLTPAHNMTDDDIARSWERRLRASFTVGDAATCWTWTGRVGPNGYGHAPSRRRGEPRQVAHRAVYELLVGAVPEGLELDHTCHDPLACAGGPTCAHRACVNPTHLEPVTPLENMQRGPNKRHAAARKATR